MSKFKVYIFIIYTCLSFISCKNNDSTKTKDANEGANKAQSAIAASKESNYIKTIDESSWEKITLSKIDNIYKISFSFISMGKTRICTLYATNFSEIKDEKTNALVLNPDKIKSLNIQIQPKINKINVTMDNMDDFIKTCNYWHQFVIGEYESMD